MYACTLARMHAIALISQKGGAGKTTLALNLAVAFQQAGRTSVVLDLDPQASAATWADLRNDEYPAVAAAHAPRLQAALATARDHGAALAILDTAPHAEASALAAARAADLVLIPCRPGLFDLHAVAASHDAARLAGAPAAAVLSAAPHRGTLADQACTILTELGIEVAPVAIGQRAAHVHAIALGLSVLEHEPRGKAAAEIRALHAWTAARLKQTGYHHAKE